MNFRTSESPNTIGDGAIVMLDDIELALVDTLIHLHLGAHGATGREPIADADRADLVRLALLHVGRSLTGWSDDVLAVRLATTEPEELARVARQHVTRPKMKPLTEIPPAQTIASVSFSLGQVTMALLLLDTDLVREAAAKEPTRPEYRAAFRLLADVADQLRAILTPDAPVQTPAPGATDCPLPKL